MLTHVLYHRDCNDGICAAAVAKYALGAGAIEYIPVQYGEPVPALQDGSTVYILDFSYKAPEIEELSKRMSQVVVLDHHKSAQQELAPLIGKFANVHIEFDMERSGAKMAWDYFFLRDKPFSDTPPDIYSIGMEGTIGRKETPRLVQYVQDRDLWQWKLLDSREVSAYLTTLTKNVVIWESVLIRLENEYGTFSSMVKAGEAVLASDKNKVEVAVVHSHFEEIGGYRVPVVTSPILQSEICERMKELFPDAPFVACYYVNSMGQRVYSLRCRDDFDVSVVAKQFAGGGHKQASGFTLPLGAVLSPNLLPGGMV